MDAMTPDGRRHRRHGRRGTRGRSRRHRRGRHRRAAAGAEPQMFVDAVEARCGIDLEVISGEEEGRLAYLAATSALPTSPGTPVVVFDSGGGSTQFTFGRDGQVEERFSVDVGAVRVAERHGLAAAVSTDGWTRRSPRSPPTSTVSTGRPARTPSSRLAAPRRTWPRSSTASRATTRTSCRARCLTSPRSIARSSCIAAATPRSGAADRRAPTGTGRGHPRGRLHRAHDPDEAHQDASPSATAACATVCSSIASRKTHDDVQEPSCP